MPGHLRSRIEDILTQASRGIGRYQGIDAAVQDLAREFLQEFRRDPLKISGNVIAIDLLNRVIRVSPWAR